MTLHQNTIKNNFLIIVKIIYKIFRGEKIMYYKTTYKSPLGILYLVSDEENLIGLWLEGQKYFQATLKEEPIINDQIEILQETKSWLERYFKGEKPDIKELSLKPQGSLLDKKCGSFFVKYLMVKSQLMERLLKL